MKYYKRHYVSGKKDEALETQARKKKTQTSSDPLGMKTGSRNGKNPI